jgi:catechol 2,3-dioxygenase-like lactoylglutathione lyase family enzyme
MLQIDHIGLAARDAASSARWLASILGAAEPTPDGADGDMYRIDLAHAAFLLFNPAPTVHPEHVAFRVDATRFQEIVSRLRARGIAFGNDPEAPNNGKTDDPLGGEGRVYFIDENGHLFEATY